ncbi:63_t:CDS:2, partial [Scutellospora calospora]
MEEEYGIPSSSSTSASSNKINLKIEDDKAVIDRVKEFMKDFKEPSNLYGFKHLIEDLEIKPSAKLLELFVDALLLLSDSSSFKCYTIDTIPRLELHLRTWVEVLELVFYSPTVLTRETRDKLYSNLDSFVDIHYRTTEVFNQGINHSFKPKF